MIGLERWQDVAGEYDAYRLRAASRQALSRFDWFSSGVGVAMIRMGRGAKARARMDELVAQTIAVMGVEHYQSGEARGVLAMALAATGQREAALVEFSAAARVLVNRAVRDDEAQSRSVRVLLRREILEAYLELLVEAPGVADAADRAFRIADALQFGTTQQALAQSAARAAAGQAELGELVRTDQDSKAEQAALYVQLLRLTLPPSVNCPQIMAGMRKRIETINRERDQREILIGVGFRLTPT